MELLDPVDSPFFAGWVEDAGLGVGVECNEELHSGPAEFEHRKAVQSASGG